ncbi:hypothetical protein WOSG25_020060 [Weissella oryzae SG25]|uniref:Uncharacterized protein n=1 Tax=Weissella oryzae (strain DSM 25784 / JCM 18191 / LMG 30913 / SG25) TaxID=1329250 RepID=A0A069CYQ9_WEIOS|nr:hypothetical protein [Weissella oryzae]GAK30211.1 hypothetical protein WOSG25_020060 [Weissella oryzae SG25]
MQKLFNYFPLLMLVVGFILISIGAFICSIMLGFVISGLLLIVLAYLVIPKGDNQ